MGTSLIVWLLWHIKSLLWRTLHQYEQNIQALMRDTVIVNKQAMSVIGQLTELVMVATGDYFRDPENEEAAASSEGRGLSSPLSAGEVEE